MVSHIVLGLYTGDEYIGFRQRLGLGLRLGFRFRARVCVGLMMCLGAVDGARTYGGGLNTTSIPGL